jgi:hypothetical protein
MRGGSMAVSGRHTRAELVVLIMGLMGVCEALWLGEGMPAGLPLHAEATYEQTAPQVMKATAQVFTVTLTEDQQVDVRGTDLTIAVRRVRDFTSQGCLGGPVGCPDHVALEVRRRGESQQISLYVTQTEAQRTQGLQQTSVFGYHIALTALHGRQVTLSIAKQR